MTICVRCGRPRNEHVALPGFGHQLNGSSIGGAYGSAIAVILCPTAMFEAGEIPDPPEPRPARHFDLDDEATPYDTARPLPRRR